MIDRSMIDGAFIVRVNVSNGKFRLRTADQLLELMETIGPLLPTVRFPFVVVQSAHDEAVLHEGTALLFEQELHPHWKLMAQTFHIQLRIDIGATLPQSRFDPPKPGSSRIRGG